MKQKLFTIGLWVAIIVWIILCIGGLIGAIVWIANHVKIV